MKIDKYSVNHNYTILRGFLDIIGFLLAYLIVQTSIAFVDANVHPDAVLKSLFPPDKYPGGVPVENWIWGFIFPLIAFIYCIISVVFIFIRHKAPKNFSIDAKNAQKYYDVLMIGNCLLRIIALMALWDMAYIHQSNLLHSNLSWFSLQTILGVAVAALVIFVLRKRVQAFASKKPSAADKKNDEIMRS